MKKLFLFLLVATLSFVSCSDEEENNLDPIVGTWEFVEFSDNECKKQSYIKFEENGTYFSKSYIEIDGECKEDGSLESAKWENNGDETYKFTYKNKIETHKIVFSNNNNTLTATTSENVYVLNRK